MGSYTLRKSCVKEVDGPYKFEIGERDDKYAKIRWKTKDLETWEAPSYAWLFSSVHDEIMQRVALRPKRSFSGSASEDDDRALTKKKAKTVPLQSLGIYTPDAPKYNSKPKYENGNSLIVVNRAAQQQKPDYIAFMKKLAKLPGPQITLVNEVDDDPSPPVDFEFLDKLKLGDGLTAYDPSSQVWGCNCPTSGCVDPTSCTDFDDFEPDSPHRMFAYGKHGRLLSARGNEVAIYECNLNCPCDMGCVNRLVQRGRKIPLEIFKTANKGWGLRCPQKLQRGVLVEVYLGEVITSEEADKRYGFGEGVSYLFQLDKFSTILEKHHQDELSAGMAGAEEEDSGEDSPYCIDGKQCGSVARFINHSCQPNLDVYCVVSDRRDGRVYDIALFTNRIIEAGEELTFSYTERHPKMMDSKKAGTDYAKCLCGAKKCAGYLWTAQNVD